MSTALLLLCMVMEPTAGILLHPLALHALEVSPGLSIALFPVSPVASENGQNAARCYVGLFGLATTGVTMPINRVRSVVRMWLVPPSRATTRLLNIMVLVVSHILLSRCGVIG